MGRTGFHLLGGSRGEASPQPLISPPSEVKIQELFMLDAIEIGSICSAQFGNSQIVQRFINWCTFCEWQGNL